MKSKKLIRYPNKQKAIDKAIWLNFKNQNNKYGSILSVKGDYLLVPKNHQSFKGESFEVLPNDYSKISYPHIQQIAIDEDPLDHLEEIRGMFSTTSGELLRFILKTKLPLKKFIRYQLALSGYDENFDWVGFDKAEEIWLK